MIIDLNGYVRIFGNKTFLESPFNDVDALVLADLSYVNFCSLAPSISKPHARPFYLKDIPLGESKSIAKDEFVADENVELLTLLRSSIRFRNIGLCYVENDYCLQSEKQFYAMTCVLPDGTRYISFRGTDLTLVGWKEDCNMSFQKEIPAQKTAVDYVDKVTSLFKNNFIIGGHSKGGNLAFFAALTMDENLMDRCIKVYSFDGPGFYDDELYKSDRYLLMKDKLIKIVPRDSLVGIMLNHTKNARVVDANSLSIFQHNPFRWKIDSKTGDFMYLKKRAEQSYINERALSNWLSSLSNEERIMATNAIFELLGGTQYSLTHLIKNFGATIANFFKVSNSYSKEEKEKLNDILKRLFYYFNKARDSYNQERLNKFIEKAKTTVNKKEK